MKKKKLIPSSKISLDIISFQINEMHKDVAKNTRDIEQLKHQVSMGKGGIKAVFVIGSVIALVLGGIKLFKIW
tara:strand:- start:1691 stop:1909 length:219 start_codon:yes stop_codon:yes gene_type:complete